MEKEKVCPICGKEKKPEKKTCCSRECVNTWLMKVWQRKKNKDA